MNVRTKIADLAQRAQDIRRTLHAIPEEGFAEVKTQQKIIEILRSLDLNPHITANTGVYCLIPGMNTQKTIAFRGDMDGLSVVEQTGMDFASSHPSMMHACGHDGHMTLLLLLATYLQGQQITPPCNVLLLFQPAEEGPGGAKIIVEERVLEEMNVSEIYGCHIMPDVEQGKIAVRSGPMMAQTGEIYFEITGKSAHGAAPHKGLDAIVAASHLVLALQSIVSRNVDPVKTSLITIGTIQGGERLNVIAGSVSLAGTMRSYEEGVYDTMKERIREVAKGVSLSSGCPIEVTFVDMYPPVVNPQGLTQRFVELLGDDEWEEAEPLMIAEDFSFYQKVVPGLFFYLGSKNEGKGFTYGLHDSRFNFDETILLNGVEVYARLLDREGGKG